jgi:hypothetical protein
MALQYWYYFPVKNNILNCNVSTMHLCHKDQSSWLWWGGLNEEYMLYIRNILLQCYSYTATFPEYSPVLYIKLDLQCIYITLRCNVAGYVRGYRPSDYIYAALWNILLRCYNYIAIFSVYSPLIYNILRYCNVSIIQLRHRYTIVGGTLNIFQILAINIQYI